MENNDNRKFTNKLYLDPIESINTTKLIKPKGYRIKGDSSKDNQKIKILIIRLQKFIFNIGVI